MSFVFDKKMSFLEVGTRYKGVITNASLVSDAKSERILINVKVEGFVSPAPASFNVSNEQGQNLALQFLSQLGAKTSKDIKVTLDSLKGKEVSVSINEVEVNGITYLNTRVNAPTANTATNTATLASEDDLAI